TLIAIFFKIFKKINLFTPNTNFLLWSDYKGGKSHKNKGGLLYRIFSSGCHNASVINGNW
ncbi:MAG: hypothetical protein ABH870_07965, partial [bacterium]